ncbi:tyrosine-type recombinase/integrase [Caulobacter sp. Root1455]|uniref:tyrosine-type recombinase/integrase n=1 Tax=Caulobacter sp. Root1455 TaxID=1736465 RepID=UPI000B2F47CC|nr:site-specific integrase [Caulobacter sp. Root1455]
MWDEVWDKMARLWERLTALQVKRTTRPGMHPDGGGLYLMVQKGGGKSWVYRYMLQGRAREMGLGPAHTISLSEARAMARDARRLKFDGIDPIEQRQLARTRSTLEAAKGFTFKQAASAYIRANKAGWRNEKHAQQWESTLTTYADPIFGNRGVSDIDTGLVLAVLEPIWSTKPETASRVRGRVEAVLDWATARGLREGENPARWKGHLEKLLPAKSRVHKVEHHAALPYAELSAFMAALKDQPGTGARALEFTILTATRTGEVIGAEWNEIDLAARVWTIPADRMKGRKEHRIPLTAPLIEILEGRKADYAAVIRRVLESKRQPIPDDIPPVGPLFWGTLFGKKLSNMAMLAVLKRMKREDLTAHGFRSTFRDWAAETTEYRSEIVEMALAHTIGNKVEAAYRRGDLFEKRKLLMEDWAVAAGCAQLAAKPAPDAYDTPEARPI